MNEVTHNDGQTEFPNQIRRIISDLKSTIDQLNSNFENAKKLILELARRLDEDRLCERNQICRRIKDILKDKIQQGHITAKWVEDCLPEEYKRKYIKSEVSSLSKKAKKLQEMVIDNNGNIREELISPNRSDTENTPFRESLLQKEQLENLGKQDDNEGRCPRCPRLEEAPLKATQIPTAEYLINGEIRITVSKDRYEEIKSAMQKSNDFFYIIFNSTSRSFVRAELEINELI